MADPLSSLIRPLPGRCCPPSTGSRRPPRTPVWPPRSRPRPTPGDVVLELTAAAAGWRVPPSSACGACTRWSRRRSPRSSRRSCCARRTCATSTPAVTNLATHPRGEVGCASDRSSCCHAALPDCGGPVAWRSSSGTRGGGAVARSFRCAHCRIGARSTAGRSRRCADEDLRHSLALGDGSRPVGRAPPRFPVLDRAHPLPDDLLDLYHAAHWTASRPSSSASSRTCGRRRSRPRCGWPSLHLVLPASRLNGYPGRVAALRVVNGHVQPPGEPAVPGARPVARVRGGCRAVRGFVQRLERAPTGLQARPGGDLAALLDGSANVVLRTGAPLTARHRVPASRRAGRSCPAARPASRVRLVLTQPPVHWSPETLVRLPHDRARAGLRRRGDAAAGGALRAAAARRMGREAAAPATLAARRHVRSWPRRARRRGARPHRPGRARGGRPRRCRRGVSG